MSLKTWNNGDKGETVQAIIEANFKLLGRHLSNNVLALSTKERNSLSSDYLSDKLVVYDKDLETWLIYTNGKWIRGTGFGAGVGYEQEFSSSEWIDGKLFIPFSSHLVPSPCVCVYIKNDSEYENVIDSFVIDSECNVTLYSDMPFAGKVIVK